MIPSGPDGMPHAVPGEGELLLVADHASNHVPSDVDLGIPPALLNRHMAYDIGVAALGTALCDALGCAGLLGRVSRLMLDTNRALDSAGLVPEVSDGHPIPGNRLDHAGRNARIDRVWRPWHDGVAATVAARRPRLLLSLHSFTPRLADMAEDRPWQVGVLYNQDERAARVAIPAFRAAGLVTGDNEPYSGRVLNHTMDLHAEANGIPYLGLEVRQDLVADPDGVAAWCNIIAPIVRLTLGTLRETSVRD